MRKNRKQFYLDQTLNESVDSETSLDEAAEDLDADGLVNLRDIFKCCHIATLNNEVPQFKEQFINDRHNQLKVSHRYVIMKSLWRKHFSNWWQRLHSILTPVSIMLQHLSDFFILKPNFKVRGSHWSNDSIRCSDRPMRTEKKHLHPIYQKVFKTFGSSLNKESVQHSNLIKAKLIPNTNLTKLNFSWGKFRYS